MNQLKCRVEFLYLDEQDMLDAGVFDAGKCVDTIEEVFKLLSEGDYVMGGRNRNSHGIQLIFPKESEIEDFPLEDAPDRRFMSMPAYLGGRFHIAGEKFYGSNGRNLASGLPRSILMVTLNDVETGQPLAYMSANILSAMRTGAVPGVVAKQLANKDAKVLSLLGAGVMNKTAMMAILSQCENIDTVLIKGSSPTSKSAAKLAEFTKENYPEIKNVKICATMEEALTEADVVSEAVSTKPYEWPYIDPKYLKPGCVFISSGTIKMDWDFMLNNTSKVVDNIVMYEEYLEIYDEIDEETGKRKWSGIPGMYFMNMVEDGDLDKKEVQQLGDIVRGLAPGRQNHEEIFLVSVGGMPILDVAWGYDCLQEAKKKGLGTKLKVWDEPFLI